MTAPVPFPDHRRRVAGGNGGGSIDERIHAIELDVLEIRTRMENAATKNDIDRLELRAAGGASAGAPAIIGWLVVWISRLPAAAPAPPGG